MTTSFRFTVFAALVLGGCAQDRSGNPAKESARSAEVLLFLAVDCPISNAYAPEISRIVAGYDGRPVGFNAIYTDPALSEADARRHASEYRLPLTVRMDSDQAWARRVGATTTPEAAVLDATGRVAYLGRINNLYYDFGKRRSVATQHDLRNAIDAVLDGRNVEHARVPAIGCEIPPPR